MLQEIVATSVDGSRAELYLAREHQMAQSD